MTLEFAPRSMARLAGAAFVAVLLLMGGAQQGFAQRLTPDAFLKLGDQKSILQPYPNGGPALVAQIRDLVVASKDTLGPVISLLSDANKDQKNAIAAGLAQAAKIVVGSRDQAYATQIQQAILDTRDQDVVLAYAGAAGDQPIGAGGGGGAASGGASGGQTNPISGGSSGTGTPAQDIPGGSTPTQQFSFTSAAGGTSGFSNLTSTPSQ
jgi:hypothetical protein